VRADTNAADVVTYDAREDAQCERRSDLIDVEAFHLLRLQTTAVNRGPLDHLFDRVPRPAAVFPR